MIDRFIIFLFFAFFLFYPLSQNIIFNGNISSKIQNNNRTKTSGYINEINYNIAPSRHNFITNAINLSSSSVVGITVTKIDHKIIQAKSKAPFGSIKNHKFFPYTKSFEIESLGSGLIYSSDGYVITNAHVVEGATEIFVTLSGGEKFGSQVVGYDQLTDIALLKVNDVNLPLSKFGDSNNLIIGEWVIALGNPLGLFDLSYEPTATIGIISGLNVDFGLKESGHVYRDMIQTDASINEGNSGGPLINIHGEVIGINTFIMTGSDDNLGSIGIGFSIPINLVKDIVEDLQLYGKVNRDYYTGLKVKPMTKKVKKYLNVPFDGGVVVVDVEKKSAAANAKIQIGDIILNVDGVLVNSARDIKRVNDENLRKSGDVIEIEIWRNKQRFIVDLELKNYIGLGGR